MTTIHGAFGTVVRERRIQRGLSQEALAARAGIPRTYVSAIERGRVRIGLEAARRLAVGLGVPLADLVAEAEINLNQSGKRDAGESDD